MAKSNRRKCPKCRTTNIEIIEIWDASIYWYPEEDYYNQGALTPGYPQKVQGKCCECSHSWTFRGVTQVDKSWFESNE